MIIQSGLRFFTVHFKNKKYQYIKMISDYILKSFRGKNVLVTGGTGLIGRQVVKILCDVGAKVYIVSLDKVVVDERATHTIADLTEFSTCREVIKDMEFVFHLAGVKGSAKVSTTMPAAHFIPTLMFNTNVIEACRINGVKKFVYTSSIGAYSSGEVFRENDYAIGSNPMDLAGWAKRMAELQIQAYKTQYGMESFAVVRPCNVYGPGDNFDPENAMVIPTIMYRIFKKEDPVVVWGDGSAIRDFAFSRDVAEGTILALYHGTRGEFVNLGCGGDGITIRELIKALNSFLDFNYVFDPEKPSGYPKRVMDISRAREWIGYNPSTSLADGLKETWEWFIQNQDEYLQKKNYFIGDA